ncbi:MAG: phytoene desaturase family protein [Mycobacteriaceae bacterium]
MAAVVVLGAGVAGLAVAGRLAAGGHGVSLLEAASSTGGKLGTASADGFTWDTGPSLLTWPELLAETLVAVGATPLETVRLDPAFTYHFADGTTLVVPDGPPPRVAAAMGAQLGGSAARDWAALMAYAREVFDVVEQPFLRRNLTPLALAAQATRLPALAQVAPWRTLRQVGQRYLRDPRLQMVLDRYATYTGSDPRRTPAPLVTVPHVEQVFGAHYVPGGLRRIVDALEVGARDVGVTVRTDARVVRIETAAGAVTGVQLADGERLPADVVVSGTDHTVTSTLLGRAAPRRHLPAPEPSLAGLVLLLGVRGVPAVNGRPIGHHTVTFPADYDAEFDDVFAGRPAHDPAIYLTCPDDPSTAPPGHRAVFVLVNAPRHDPRRGTDWDAAGPGQAERVLSLLRSRGVDLGEVLTQRVLTPADLERTTGAPGGSIYGSSSHGAAAAFLRAPNRSRVSGLFSVGGSAHPGGGLPLVLLSAQIVAEHLGAAR